METMKKYLEALKTDPKAAELLKGAGELKNASEFCAFHAKIAEVLGFILTKEDLLNYLSEMEKKVAGESDKAAEAFEELSTEELEKIAGGKDCDECQDTFKQRENCWHNDGCDVVYNDYPGIYSCLHHYHGGASMCDYFVVYDIF